MSNLIESNIVVHSNSFETALCEKTTMADVRFIAIYLSKINPKNPDMRTVVFSLDEYATLMQLKRKDVRAVKCSAARLMQQSVLVDKENGGFTAMSVFERFDFDKKGEEWIISLTCTGTVSPYFFYLREKFTQYELWNILNLTERNHQQLFRLLKQYQKIKAVTFEIPDLKFRLGIDGRYPEYKAFKRAVIIPCQKALSEKTDIRFDYEPIRKGRKVHAIKFTIHKNTPPGDKPLLSEFVADMANESSIALDQQDDQGSFVDGFQLSTSGQARAYSDPNVIFFAEACNNEFSEAEMNRLIDALRRTVTQKSNAYDGIEFDRFHVLQTAYLEMCARPKVYNRVSYLLKILEANEPATT